MGKIRKHDLDREYGEGDFGRNHSERVQSRAVDFDENPIRLTAALIVTAIPGALSKIDDKFIPECERILAFIDRECERQGDRPYNDIERHILVNELYRLYLDYLPKKRKSGESVFYSHLIGSLEILVNIAGLIGLAAVVGMLKHDVVEDLVDKDAEPKEKARQEAALYAFLVDFNSYKDALGPLEETVEASIQAIIDEVRLIATGATKLRHAKDEVTDAATFQRFLSVAAECVRVVFVKAADRLHNMVTIGGHGFDEAGMAKQLKIMSEAERKYLPLIRILSIRKLVKSYVDELLKFFNPKLQEDFGSFQQERFKARKNGAFDKTMKKAFDTKIAQGKNRNLDNFVDVEVIDYGLEAYTTGIDKSFSEMVFEDLKISSLDPMREILVTVNVNVEELSKVAEFARNKARIAGRRHGEKLFAGGRFKSMDEALAIAAAKFDPHRAMEEAEHDFKVRVLSEMGFYIQSKFASSPKVHAGSENPGFGSVDSSTGVKLIIFNPVLGGQLHFRINTVVDEHRSKRGVLHGSGGGTPKQVRNTIKSILSRGGSIRSHDLMDAAAEDLLSARIEVVTPMEDKISLPTGATGLDFAAALHDDLAVGIQGIVKHEHVLSIKPEVNCSPFDPLEDGALYFVDSCLGGRRKNPSKIAANPSWVLFCQTDRGASAIKSYLNGLDREDKLKQGKKYLESLVKMYNIKFEDLFRVIYDNFQARYRKGDKYSSREMIDEDIITRVGTGEIDPVFLLATFTSFKLGRWEKNRDRRERNLLRRAESVPVEDKAYSWEIECKMSEKQGTLAKFMREFSEEVGIPIKHFKDHIPGVGGGPGTVRLVFDLKGGNVSVYEFFRKIVKLGLKYEVNLAGDFMGRYPVRERNRGGLAEDNAGYE